jgi:ATP-dependent DNA helicase PIF1
LAAINVGGQTIHSFFRFPPRLIDKSKVKRLRGAEVLRRVEAVIIDEVSMVRADLMDGMDMTLRLNRDAPSVPFGGVQMIFFGDLSQLPPIVREQEVREYLDTRYGGAYFFHAKAFAEMDLGCVELKKIYRQTDAAFIGLLDAIRRNQADAATLAAINSRVRSPEEMDFEEGLVILTTTNEAAFRRNEEYLARIREPEFTYQATIADRFDEPLYPTEAALRLKVGAQVMMVRNDPERRWVNGSIGRVSSLGVDTVGVEIDGTCHDVDRDLWENIEYQYDQAQKKIHEKVVGTFLQFPLRLAWAITIHKSQGQTFRKVYIDLGWGAFTHGQTYVALSRCTSFEGLYLARPVMPRDVIFDESIEEFNKIFRR